MKREAIRIVRRLRSAGFSAYLVGGCVRDLLLGRRPKDYDVATDARPEDVIRLFPKTIPVGKQFGVVIVRSQGRNFEVATFREEWGYSDGRRPDRVRFSTARGDARRRDFTINGLFYDPVAERVIDYVGGKKDLAAGKLRAIGDPEARFREDKLRLLRAVRFSARFNFPIERRTARAIRRHAAEVIEVSPERIREELAQILQGERPGPGVRLLDELGLLQAVLPEAAAMKGVPQPPEFHPEGDVFIHTLLMLDRMKPGYARRPGFAWAVLLHDVGKPPTFEVADRIRFNLHALRGAQMSEKILRRLRGSREEIKTVADLVKHHLRFIDAPRMRQSTLKRFLRQDNFDLHLELHRLDCLASHGDLSTWRFCRGQLKKLQAQKQPLKPPRLLTGNDLIAQGLAPGPLFKELLGALEDAQLEGVVRTREQALDWLRQRLARGRPGA